MITVWHVCVMTADGRSRDVYVEAPTYERALRIAEKRAKKIARRYGNAGYTAPVRDRLIEVRTELQVREWLKRAKHDAA